MTPDFFHIGIPKSGTTTIQSVLREDKRLKVTSTRLYTTKDWWIREKTIAKSNKIHIESNETILMGGFSKVKFPEVIKRIYNDNPAAQIIITIRNQPEAICSMFKYLVKNKKVDEQNIASWMYKSNMGMDFLSICQYATIAKSIMGYFPKDQIHFLFFEDLKYDKTLFFDKLYNILGIPSKLNKDIIPVKNAGNFSDNQLASLHSIRKLTIFKNKYPSKKWYAILARKEKKMHQYIAKIIPLKVSKDFLSFKESKGYKNLISEITQSNNQLANEGFVPLEKLKKYNYPL